MISWKLFFENTSTREELIEFALGNGPFRKFAKYCSDYSKELRNEISKMRRMGAVGARARAQLAIRRRGWSR